MASLAFRTLLTWLNCCYILLDSFLNSAIRGQWNWYRDEGGNDGASFLQYLIFISIFFFHGKVKSISSLVSGSLQMGLGNEILPREFQIIQL